MGSEEFVVRMSDVPPVSHTPGGSVRFIHGDEHGMGAISLLLSESPPGGGAPTHRHPTSEVYVVEQGRGRYDVGGVEVVAEVGDVVVVPPGTWHSFVADGIEPLRHVAIFDGAHMETEMPPR